MVATIDGFDNHTNYDVVGTFLYSQLTVVTMLLTLLFEMLTMWLTIVAMLLTC